MPPRRPARPTRAPRTPPSPAPALSPDASNLAAALRLVADAVRADAGLDDPYSYGATVGVTDEDIISDPTDYHDTLDEDEEIVASHAA
jgi:hypothetical protein